MKESNKKQSRSRKSEKPNKATKPTLSNKSAKKSILVRKDKPERTKGSNRSAKESKYKREDKPFKSRSSSEKKFVKKDSPDKPYRLSNQGKSYRNSKVSKGKDESAGIRLNRYIANAGICSRREADKLISSGIIKINNVVITELGTKVKPGDVVQYSDEKITNEKPVYLLLNKPKGYITTTDDPRGRKTVMMLVNRACKERIYPVGRLDRNTTGLLLFTNDGDLATKLMHPKHQVKKLYHVKLDKNIKQSELNKILEGIKLEDGLAKADEISFVDNSRSEVGIELHSGKNRIVRRIFEHFGYQVIKLDRVTYAGLNKKDVPRGKFRMLKEEEITWIKRIK